MSKTIRERRSPESVATFVHAMHLHTKHRPTPEDLSTLLAGSDTRVIINTPEVLLLDVDLEYGELSSKDVSFDLEWIIDALAGWECGQVMFSDAGVDYTHWLES